jgi:predicted outer membrane protein
MKKFAISLLALAAVSTAALASNRDVTTPYGAQDTKQVGVAVDSNAFAVPAGSISIGNAGDDLGLGGSNRR